MTCRDKKGSGVLGLGDTGGNGGPGVGDDPYEGSGLLGLPGDSTSDSRFVRLNKLAFCAGTWNGGPDADQLVQTAFRLIGRAETLRGEVRSIFGPLTTELTIVRALEHLDPRTGRNPSQLYFRTEVNQSIRVIDLAKIDFGHLPPLKRAPVVPIDRPSYRIAQDVTPVP